MTYLELINRFWKIEQQVQFTGYETKMYFALLEIANRLYWKHKDLSVPNSILMNTVGCSKPTFLEARRRLVEYNLITYKAGINKRIAPIYRIVESENFVIDEVSSKEILPVNNPTGKKYAKKSTLIKDKDKYKYGESKKIHDVHDGSVEVYEFFRNNFNDSEKIISRLRNQFALGKDFVNFMLYLFEKGMTDSIAKANNPVAFIMFFAKKERDWVDYQTWQSERYKREGDAIDRHRTQSYSYNSV